MRNQNNKEKMIVLLLLASAAGVLAAGAADSSNTSETVISALDPVLEGLSGKYGWLTTLVLAVGSLRLLFKPLMLALEHALQADPAKLDRLQKFEAGPVYKGIAILLDFGASIKLPLVKPPTK
jgi:hypothetical protein